MVSMCVSLEVKIWVGGWKIGFGDLECGCMCFVGGLDIRRRGGSFRRGIVDFCARKGRRKLRKADMRSVPLMVRGL